MLTEAERKQRKKEANQRWREKNREEYNRKAREWYASLDSEKKRRINEKKSKNSNEYNKRNVEKKTAYHKEWRNTPKGKLSTAEARKKYYLKNRDKLLAYGAEYRAKLKEQNNDK